MESQKARFITGARNYPIIQNQTKPVHNPNLCARAFAESNKFPNQGALPIGYLVSIAGVGSQTIAAVFASLGGRLIMLNLPNSNVYLCVELTGIRKSFDSLAMLVRSHLGGTPCREVGSCFMEKIMPPLSFYAGPGMALTLV